LFPPDDDEESISTEKSSSSEDGEGGEGEEVLPTSEGGEGEEVLPTSMYDGFFDDNQEEEFDEKMDFEESTSHTPTPVAVKFREE